MSTEEKPAPRRPRTQRRKQQDIAALLRAKFPAILRVLLKMAKDGDVRAATLVVKLVGNTLSGSESDEFDGDALLSDLERDLESLPAAIASEIVGLLAQAAVRSPQGGAGPSAPAGGRGEQHSGRLPWQADDSPSDEGADPV